VGGQRPADAEFLAEVANQIAIKLTPFDQRHWQKQNLARS